MHGGEDLPHDPPPAVTVRVYEVGELPPEWEDGLSSPDRVAAKRFFLEAFIQGDLSGIRTTVLVVRDGQDRFLAASPVSRISLPVDCIAPPWIQRLASLARRVHADFLVLDLLMCGLPASLADHEIIFAPDLDLQWRRTAQKALVSFSVDLMEREKRVACVWKEFDEAVLESWRPVFEKGGFALFPSVPVSTQDVTWTSGAEYLERVRAPYRRQLKRNMERARQQGLSIQADLDFGPWVREFYPLYLQVLQRSKTQLETLSIRFFEELARDPRIKYLRATLGDRSVGGALCYVDEPHTLLFLYVGMDYAVLRSTDLYFNLLRAIVDLAGAKRVKALKWGQTSPDAKGRMGARLAPLKFALRLRRPFFHNVIRLASPVLFPERHQIERKVLKKQYP